MRPSSKGKPKDAAQCIAAIRLVSGTGTTTSTCQQGKGERDTTRQGRSFKHILRFILHLQNLDGLNRCLHPPASPPAPSSLEYTPPPLPLSPPPLPRPSFPFPYPPRPPPPHRQKIKQFKAVIHYERSTRCPSPSRKWFLVGCSPTFFMRLVEHLTALRLMQAMPSCSVKTLRTPTRQYRDARVYGVKTTAANENEDKSRPSLRRRPPPPSSPLPPLHPPTLPPPQPLPLCILLPRGCGETTKRARLHSGFSYTPSPPCLAKQDGGKISKQFLCNI